MSEYQRFMQAIFESPDCRLPRLAFADWLEESGDVKRAEFIRLAPPGKHKRSSWGRWDWLNDKYGFGEMIFCGYPVKYMPFVELAQRTRRSIDWYTFRDGFIDEVCGSIDGLCLVVPGIMLSHPVRRLKIVPKSDHELSDSFIYYPKLGVWQCVYDKSWIIDGLMIDSLNDAWQIIDVIAQHLHRHLWRKRIELRAFNYDHNAIIEHSFKAVSR